MKIDGLFPFNLNCYDLKTLSFKSKSLENNPLNDPVYRAVPILVPKYISADTPVVFYLSGFASDGWKNTSFNRFENNTVQDIDHWTSEEIIPSATYIFVSAWTKWGGSQFINSKGMGNYEDYLVHDLASEVKLSFPEIQENENWIVMGGSSGGYGALHLGSKYPRLFNHVIAIAPDSLFEISLLPEIYKYLPYLNEHGGFDKFILNFTHENMKYSDHILFGLKNIVAMTLCYATKDSNNNFKIPIDKDGKIIESIWQEWVQHDPVNFLKQRTETAIQLKSVCIYAGDKDEHSLQYGSKQIYQILKSAGANVTYSEHPGTHRSINQFRLPALSDVLKSL